MIGRLIAYCIAVYGLYLAARLLFLLHIFGALGFVLILTVAPISFSSGEFSSGIKALIMGAILVALSMNFGL